MLTLKVSETCKIAVVDPGEGHWKKKITALAGYHTVLVGMDGECQLTILRSAMQSGDEDVVLVFTQVDGPNIVRQKTFKFQDVEKGVNELLREIEKELGYEL